MKNKGKCEFIGDLKLSDKPSFLVFLGGMHPVKIESDFSPGTDLGAQGKRTDGGQGLFRAVFCIVWMNPHGRIESILFFSQ